VDDRDRRAPVALAADQPVAQAIRDGGPALARALEVADDPPAALVGRQAGVAAAVDEPLAGRVGDVRAVELASSSPGAATTRRIGSPNFSANA
jgi:hypothetical protein